MRLPKLKEIDLTKGNLFLRLFLFALPIALTTILQLLYTHVDLISVRTGESLIASTSIQATNVLINLIVIVFSATSLGSNVAIGNAKGAGNQEKAQKLLHTSLIFALILGVVVGLVGVFMSPLFLQMMNTDEEHIGSATLYLRIYFAGLPFLMLYNYSAQMLRAIGDSGTPFIILLISGLLNVGLDFLLVNLFHFGVAGAAVATIFSELVSCALAILAFKFKKNCYLRLRLKELRIDKESLLEVVQLGLPAGLQGFFFALPNTFVQGALFSISHGNIDVENGAIAAEALNGYCYAFVEATSSATMSMTAQNYGAKNKQNIKKALLFGNIWVIIFCGIYALLILFANRPLMSIFLGDANEATYEAARQRLFVLAFTYFLDGIMDVSAGSMKGVRHPIPPAIITILTCTITRIVLIETVILRVDYFKNVTWLYSLYPISWVLAIIGDAICIPVIFKKEFFKIENQKAMEEKKRTPQSQRFID